MRTDPVHLDTIHPIDCRCAFHRSADNAPVLDPEDVSAIKFGVIGGIVLDVAIIALHYAPEIIAQVHQ